MNIRIKLPPVKITAECEPCGGTGLYSGFMEGPGRAVVCTRCGGSGAQKLSIKPFQGRRTRRGIKEIRFGSGLIVDNPRRGEWMSYAEFKKLVPVK